MIETRENSLSDEKSFREQISEFMDEYSQAIGFAEGFTAALVSDSILTTIENTIKNNKYAQLSSELTSSFIGIKEQMTLSQMNTALGALSKLIKVFPAVSLANSLYEDWHQGNDYPYNTMKDALIITTGIMVCGIVTTVSGVATLPILASAVIAGSVGSLIDNYWDDIRNQFDDLLDIKSSINASFTTAQEQASPLALDLDGDGVETTTVESGVYFDHDNNGFAESNNSVLSSGEKAA